MGLPETEHDMTAAWFTATLGRPVTEVTIEPLGEGVGVMGVVRRAHLTGAPDLPASVIVKLPAPPGPNRATATVFGMYAREVEFYRQAAPLMDVRVPRCEYAERTDDGAFVLVLEDVAGRSVDQLAGCSLADAERLVDEIARLHVHWWDFPDERAVRWLPTMDNEAYRSFAPMIPALAPGLRARFGDRLDPAGFPLVDRLAAGGYLELLAFWERTGPLTFAHYDLRLDNLLFEDERVCLLDWQFAVRHRGTFDLSYFLGQSVPPEFRRAHQDHLVRRYHAALRDAGVGGYSLEHCEDDYRAGMLMHIAAALQIASMDGGNARGQQLLESMATSGWNAAVELDAAEVVFAAGR